MKSLLLFFILLVNSIPTIAQMVEGVYANKWSSSSGESIAYELTLKEDGTFTFRSNRSYKDSIPDTIIEAQGIWEMEGRLLRLKTEENSSELSSKLNKNTARYVGVSSRNPRNNSKPSFKFYESAVFYAKNMELIQTEVDVNLTD